MTLLLPGVCASLDPGWVVDPLYRAAGQLPAVDWRFAEDRSLVDRIRGATLTFTRTTGRTWVQADGSNGTLSANEPAFIYRNGISLGLDVWESRTNLFLDSSAPATQSITVTAAAHTLSFKGTGTITLSGASTAGPLVGTGANDRVILTLTPSAGSLTLTLGGTITEPMLELGGTVSPFIPTAGGSVQRTTELCSTTDLSWYNPAGGVFYVEYSLTSATINRTIVEVTDGTSNNRLTVRFASGLQAGYNVLTGGSLIVNSIPAGYSSDGAYRQAATLITDNFQRAINGVFPTAAVTSGAVPPLDRLFVGISRNSTEQLCQPIARLAYFPPGPAVNRLQRMTA